MKIISIMVGRGATVNLGNYESARLDVSYTASVDVGESAEEVRRRLEVVAATALEENIRRFSDEVPSKFGV